MENFFMILWISTTQKMKTMSQDNRERESSTQILKCLVPHLEISIIPYINWMIFQTNTG